MWVTDVFLLTWLAVSAKEWMNSENMLCEPVYHQLASLKAALAAFLQNIKLLIALLLLFC